MQQQYNAYGRSRPEDFGSRPRLNVSPTPLQPKKFPYLGCMPYRTCLENYKWQMSNSYTAHVHAGLSCVLTPACSCSTAVPDQPCPCCVLLHAPRSACLGRTAGSSTGGCRAALLHSPSRRCWVGDAILSYPIHRRVDCSILLW